MLQRLMKFIFGPAWFCWFSLYLCLPPRALASPPLELDQQFKLESIGLLKALDNTEGLFSELIEKIYLDFFSQQSRFILNDLSKTNLLLKNSKLSYEKMIQDPELLLQIAQASQIETFIRTQFIKKGQKYSVTLEWFHLPPLQLIASVQFDLEEPSGGVLLNEEFLSQPFKKQLRNLISQVPFYANITGKSEQLVTINMGAQDMLRIGDVLTVAELVEIRSHPILKYIVDWKFSPTGKILVDQLENGIAFCKILEEFPDKKILTNQKVIQIRSEDSESLPESIGLVNQDLLVNQKKSSPTKVFDSDSQNVAPTMGWLSTGLSIGGQSWNFSSLTTSTYSGGGLALGGEIEGQAWLTREWFAELTFKYLSWNFTQHNDQTGASTPTSEQGGVPGSFTYTRIDLGYHFFLNSDFEGIKTWFKVGYKANDYQLPVSKTENTGPLTLHSVFLGLGVDLPFQEEWGMIGNLNFRLISWTSIPWINSSIDSITDVEVNLAGYRKISRNLVLKIYLDVKNAQINFSKNTSLYQKVLTVNPVLMYYF